MQTFWDRHNHATSRLYDSERDPRPDDPTNTRRSRKVSMRKFIPFVTNIGPGQEDPSRIGNHQRHRNNLQTDAAWQQKGNSKGKWRSNSHLLGAYSNVYKLSLVSVKRPINQSARRTSICLMLFIFLTSFRQDTLLIQDLERLTLLLRKRASNS